METAPTVEIDGWTLRQRMPDGNGPHPVILMLHGWTGDENVMWIFASRLPTNAWLIAPRGLYPTPNQQGGFGWTPGLRTTWPTMEDFRPAVDRLLGWMTHRNFTGARLARFDILGFSQGAALGFSLALLHPDRVRAVAGLSGFVPDVAEEYAKSRPLSGRTAFMAHGVRDDTVPVARARHGADILRQAGAEVFYCEDDVGHKLSAGCFRSLQVFFEDLTETDSPD